MKGQKVCRLHGGRAPQAKAKAKRELEQAAAKKATQLLGLPIETTPDQALLDELYRTAGEVAWLDIKVRAIHEHELEEGNTWHRLWVAAREHLLKVAEACKKANIEERRIQLAEDQGRAIAAVLQRIFNRLELTPHQQALIPVIVPHELRTLTPPEENHQ